MLYIKILVLEEKNIFCLNFYLFSVDAFADSHLSKF